MRNPAKHLTLILLAIVSLIACKNQNNSSTQKDADSSSSAEPKAKEPQNKIVSLGGAITEIVSELGYGDQIVGVDMTSTFPEKVVENAKGLGHVRSLNVEQVLALDPDLILAPAKNISKNLREKLKSSDAEVHFFQRDYTVKGTYALIDKIGKILQAKETDLLREQIKEDLSQVKTLKQPPKVLFIYARGQGTMMVAGKNTAMQKMVDLAGGNYAIENFESFKPLTPESLIQQNPDVLLLFNSGLQSLGGTTGLMEVKGISETRAGKEGNVISMEGGFLTAFGPRLGKAAVELNKKLAQFAE